MGHKKTARANRLGLWIKRERDLEPRRVAEYDSVWFSDYKKFGQDLCEDWQIRELIKEKYGEKSGISKVKISKTSGKTDVDIFSIKPATVFGRDNQKIEDLKNSLKKIVKNARVNVLEIDQNDPQIIAEKIAIDLERRIAFRKSCKTHMSKAMASPDVDGIRVSVSGRLGGAEIARTEWYKEGKISLQTWHYPISNGFAKAITTYGIIGVKVIVNRKNQKANPAKKQQSDPSGKAENRENRENRGQRRPSRQKAQAQ